jgi:tRNA A-37 threonylcarbamoyl transferase component Bud32
MGAEVMKESRWRWAGILSFPKGRRLFLKRDRSKGWFETAKYFLLPSRGRREWIVAAQLKERQVNVPHPLGWMERREQGCVKESYYLSEAIGSGVPYLTDAVRLARGDSIVTLARTVRTLHDVGLFHKDFHGGNFLWEGDSLYLTDLHGSKVVRSVSLKRRVWMMSHLLHSLRSVYGEGDRIRFVETYFEQDSLSRQKMEGWVRTIDLQMERLQRRQWQSRTKRCLRESTDFTIEKERETVCHRRRDFPPGPLQKAVDEHRRMVRGNPSALVKCSPEVRVSIVDSGEKKVCVKAFHALSLWRRTKDHFRRDRGVKAWVAGNGLRVRGIPGVEPLALVKVKHGMGARESLFLMEALAHGEELDRYLVKELDDFRKKRRFINSFAQWLAHLHQGRIYHQDLKTCNLWVSEKGGDWEYRLLDLEDVQLDKRVDKRDLFRNLLQLNASVPGKITRTDRLRFLRHYLTHRFVGLNKRAWVKKIAEETQRRGVVYVAPWGVVQENSSSHRNA